jgi:hypothetical protein
MSYKKYIRKSNLAPRTTVRRRHKDYSLIFFDDMKYNIDDMKTHFGSHIECVYLPHKPTNLRLDVASIDGDSSSISHHSNTYVQNAQILDAKLFTNTTKSFELEIHKPILYDWIRIHKRDTKIVVFDWDHALSVTNGVFPPNAFPQGGGGGGGGCGGVGGGGGSSYRRTQRVSYQNANIHVYDVAVFLMGGHTRLFGLRRMFAYLYRRGCKVFILTANSIANTSRTEFVKVIQVIIPRFRETHLVCSNRGPGTDSSKSAALCASAAFRSLVDGSPSACH